MLAMSDGFRFWIPPPPSGVPPKRLFGCPLAFPELEIGTPSMTYKGWLLPLAERAPLNRTLAELPRPPALGDSVIPATFPLRDSTTFSVGALFRWLPDSSCKE